MGLFSRNKNVDSNMEKQNIGDVITSEFNKFVISGKERLVLSLIELSEDDSQFYRKLLPGGWMTFDDAQHAYYNYENLEQKEKDFVMKDKEYQVVSFVAPKALGEAPYNSYGVEIISRIKSNAMLPKMKQESLFYYNSMKNFFSQENLSDFIEQSKKADYTADKIKENIAQAHKSYDLQTTQLVQKNKAQRDEALLILEKRNAPADEYLFSEMRENISKAKYSK